MKHFFESDSELSLWWSISAPGGGGTHMRVEQEGDRWKITGVYIHGDALTATDLQAVPMTQLNLIMNLVGHGAGGFLADPDDIAHVHNELAATAGYGAAVLYDPDGPEPTLARLRELADTAPGELPTAPTSERPRLTRPDGTDPDGFAERVAAAYREYAQKTRSPAIEIAREASTPGATVPVATARGWIREARRRGKLPEGRRGKAG